MPESHSTAPVRAVAYYRMSTDGQEASIPQQKAWADQAAARERLAVVAAFEDPAITGDEIGGRPGLLAMLDFCERRAAAGEPVGVVLTWDADRFSRADSISTAVCVGKLLDAGVTRMLSGEGWVDWTNEIDRVLYNLKQDLSKSGYSKSISKNVSRAMAQRARQGFWMTRPPYGYVIGPDGRLALGDPGEVEVVRWVFRRYVDTDDSLRLVSDRLNARGVPGPASRWDGDGNLLEAAPWTRCTVRGLLRDAAYVGTYTWNVTHTGKYSRVAGGGQQAVNDLLQRKGEQRRRGLKRLPAQRNPAEAVVVIPGGKHVPPLIDADTFAAAAEKLRHSRSRTNGGRPRDGHPFVLSGLLHCGCCGAVMWGGKATRHRGDKVYVYHRYWCSTSQKHGAAACRRNEVNQDDVLGKVIAQIQQALGDPAGLAELRAEVARAAAADAGDVAAERGRLEGRLAELDRQIDQGNANLALLPPDMIAGVVAKVREWQAARGQAARDLAALAAAGQAGPDLADRVEEALGQLQRLHEMAGEVDPGDLRAALRRMVSKVTLHFAHHDTGKRQYNKSTFLTAWEVELHPDLVALLGTACRSPQRTIVLKGVARVA